MGHPELFSRACDIRRRVEYMFYHTSSVSMFQLYYYNFLCSLFLFSFLCILIFETLILFLLFYSLLPSVFIF